MKRQKDELLNTMYRGLLKEISNTVLSTTGCKVSDEAIEIIIYKYEEACNKLERLLLMKGEPDL